MFLKFSRNRPSCRRDFLVVAESVDCLKVWIVHLPNSNFTLELTFLVFDQSRKVFTLAAIQNIHIDRVFLRVVTG